MSGETPGQVITFYSYKGGTGRSMALSNIACLLAQRQSLSEGKGVLIIDWDLEAPGLHRFFRDKLRSTLGSNPDKHGLSTPSLDYERRLDLHPGLIDLFEKLYEATRQAHASNAETTVESDQEPQDEETARAIIEESHPEQFILKTDVPSLYMMKAGCFDDGYAERVSKFQWETLYNRSPWLIRSLAEYLAEHYRYVIIDSRTGITDISGICTMLLPEKLVVVFTPNRQSLLGVQELVRRATRYRRESDDLRTLAVFPLPSRIEATEPTLRDSWRLGDEGKDIPGYQPLFERLFEEVYDLPACDLNNYFDEVQVQHAPSYAYGENVAVLLEKSGGRLSLSHSYEIFINWLIEHPVPWKPQEARVPEATSDQLKLAEATYARLSAEEQEATRRLFTRLVRLARPEEGGDDTRQRIKLNELFPADQRVAEEWSKARLVNIQQDESSSEKTVEPVSESLIREWKRLRAWLDEDRDFLLWRQSLRTAISKWESSGRQKDALLVGLPLAEAKQMQAKHEGDLNNVETSFIYKSINYERPLTIISISRRFKTLSAVAFLIIAIVAGILGAYWMFGYKAAETARSSKLPDHFGIFIQNGEELEELKRLDFINAVKGRDALSNTALPEASARPVLILYAEPQDIPISDLKLVQLDSLNRNGQISYWSFQVAPVEGHSGMKRISVAGGLTSGRYAFALINGYLDEGNHKLWPFEVKQGVAAPQEPPQTVTIPVKADPSVKPTPSNEPPPPGMKPGYCNEDNVVVRSSPNLDAKPVTKISKGQKLWVIRKSLNSVSWRGVVSDWSEVQLYDSSTRGWVLSVFITLGEQEAPKP